MEDSSGDERIFESVTPRSPSEGTPASGDLGPPLPIGEPTRAPGPEGFDIASLAVVGSRLFVGGSAPGTGPAVRGGERRCGSLEWPDRISLHGESDPELEYDPKLTLDVSSGTTRLAVARRGESWHASLLVLEEANGRWTRREALPPWRDSGADGFEFDYGSPLVLRGDELFTLASPGSRIEHDREPSESSSTFLHFRRNERGWRAAPLPFFPDATELWWGIALTPDGSTLGLLTEHGSDGCHVDLYQRDGPTFRATLSLAVPGTPSDVVCTSSRMVVTARQIVVLRRREGRWSEERRIELPDTERTAAGIGTHLTPIGAPDRLIVRRAEPALFDVDVEGSGIVRPIELPSGLEVRRLGAMALDGSRLFAVRGREILWWFHPG